MITLDRPPARIDHPGKTRLPSLNAWFMIGRECLAEAVPEIMEEGDRCGVLSVDVEADGKEGRSRYMAKAIIIGTSASSWVFDPRDPAQFQMLRRILNEGGYKLVYHNSTFDVPILYGIGLLDMASVARTICTLILARLAEPDEKARKTLGNAAAVHLGMEISDPLPAMLKALGISKTNWYATKDLDIPAYRIMAATDAILTHRLLPKVRQAAFNRLTEGHPFSKFGLKGADADDLVEREQIINRMCLRRTCRGFVVDPEYLDRYVDKTTAELREIEAELAALDIRPGNANDLTAWLDKQGLLPDDYPRTDKTDKPSGAKDNLTLLGHPVAERFITWKETTHTNAYLTKVMDAADNEGRIHPGTNLLGAATGRMSISGDAPLHQFPEAARGIIRADNWRDCEPLTHKVTDPCNCVTPKGMVSIDWSQIEPVVVANIAGDHEAIARYEAGEKFYDAVASFAGISYKAAKTTLLAQLYGEGIGKLAKDLRISVEEASEIRDLIWKALPGTKRLAGKGGRLQTIAQEYKLIFTLSGRIVPVPAGWWPCWNEHKNKASIIGCHKCDDRGMRYSVAVHKGVNYFVQGGAYDLLADSAVEIERQGLGDAVYLFMHDESVVDHEAAHDIRKIMETPPPRLIELSKRVPILRTDMAHLGERWNAA